MKIGELKLNSPFIAAPMAGFSDIAWRCIVSELGAGLVFSEMISAEALRRAQKKTIKFILNDKRARPFAVQLFGSKPESFAEAISILKDHPFDLLDINMGCPVKKVVSRGEGSALMKAPSIAEAVIKAVRHVYDGPLTVKIRSGWDENSRNAVDIAHIAECSGADAVIIHPRTRAQSFKGSADWKIIADAKKAVKIPVIGNGDVVDKKSADKMFEETLCDAIMIGRAALGNPWIFREACGGASPTFKERFELIERHIGLSLKFNGERGAILTMKKFLPKYLRGFKGSRDLICETYTKKTVKEMLACLNRYIGLYFSSSTISA